ncbi:hypothetical protein Sgou_01780 [Streptomyces gougerotii]|uniref:Uncharacterized protein n=1 Tax=Streptomyces gougerotii TaxID=53448 RepID=A0A8H9HTM2_9ACTN|nr:hypothetical protein Srut_03070 [Streptomyces rutgersensis]GFH75508.1 hypothetical protein Sgou_01780 [Streptomyces gougerotii]GGU88961.1 hypothetical protein GCM10010227_49880 [Streptomyces gougerotii]
MDPIRLRHASVRGAMAAVELLLTMGAVACAASLVSERGRRVGWGALMVRERVPVGRALERGAPTVARRPNPGPAERVRDWTCCPLPMPCGSRRASTWPVPGGVGAGRNVAAEAYERRERERRKAAPVREGSSGRWSRRPGRVGPYEGGAGAGCEGSASERAGGVERPGPGAATGVVPPVPRCSGARRVSR